MTWLYAATANPQKSKDFYTRLGFKALDQKRTWFTEGSLILELANDTKARNGIKIYSSNWDLLKDTLKEEQEIFEYDDGFCTNGPSHVWFYFEKEKPNIELRPKSSFSLAGNYAGVSIEVADMEHSESWLKNIGFEITMDNREHGWLSMKNKDGFGLSLLKYGSCPHSFINPSLTFFNSGKNEVFIQKIKENNIPILEEITCFNPQGIIDNVILQDPAGPGIFMFND
jgi:predicted lactoylglutathione lyase